MSKDLISIWKIFFFFDTNRPNNREIAVEHQFEK